MEKMKTVTRKELEKSVHPAFAIAILTAIACFGAWLAYSNSITRIIIGATIFCFAMTLINFSTSLSNDICDGKFYILNSQVTRIENNDIFYIGNIQIDKHKLFGNYSDVKNGDDVYIVYLRDMPISVINQSLAKLDNDLKNFVKKAKGVC